MLEGVELIGAMYKLANLCLRCLHRDLAAANLLTVTFVFLVLCLNQDLFRQHARERKMGKPIKQAEMVRAIGDHYKLVEFELLFKPASNGTNCSIMVNKKQAVAGVSFDKKSKSATPSKDECAKVADLAHAIAAAVYNSDHADKKVPKKISADSLRGS